MWLQEARVIKEECEGILAEAIPALNAAIAALDTIKKADIQLVQVSYSNLTYLHIKKQMLTKRTPVLTNLKTHALGQAKFFGQEIVGSRHQLGEVHRVKVYRRCQIREAGTGEWQGLWPAEPRMNVQAYGKRSRGIGNGESCLACSYLPSIHCPLFRRASRTPQPPLSL